MQVLSELLAMPGLYADLVTQYQLDIVIVSTRRGYDGPANNINMLSVARFLATIGFTIAEADEAHEFYCHHLTYL